MKKAIVIGATSGIGRALADILVRNNYKVGITGRRKELLDEIKSENTENYLISDFDVSNIEIADQKINTLIHDLGGLDLAIYCSGTGDLNEDLKFNIELPAIEINVRGFTFVMGYFYNYFAKNNSGHLVNISSIAGLRGSGPAPAYNASKAYQINYLEGLKQRNHKLNPNITITDVRPGFVHTSMAKGAGLFWVAPVEKAAHQIYKAMMGRRSVIYITKRWWWIAMILRVLPTAIYKRL